MSFLSPIAFWFLLTLPALITLYLLKRKRVRLTVPSSILWQRFLAETQANRPFQKLRNNLLMLLQLLLLLALTFALARPFLEGETRIGALNILILDTSASMQSEDVKPSRFSDAQRRAIEVAESMKRGEQAIVLTAGPQTQVAQSASTRIAGLRRAIQGATVTDGTAEIQDAFRLAEALIQDREDATVHLFSDGAGMESMGLDNADLPLVYHKSGNRMDNLGILSMDVRTNPENESERALFASVHNFGSEARVADVEFLFDDQLVDIQSLTLAPTNSTPVLFLFEQQDHGVASIRLRSEDDLSVDDEAWAVSRVRGSLRTLLVTPGNQFLQRALGSVDDVELYTATDYEGPDSDFDLVVIDGVAPSQWPLEVNLLAINTQPSDWFDSIDTVEAPPVVSWDTTSPLLRYVNFDGTLIANALQVKPPNWASSLMETTDSPLMLTGTVGRQRVVWIGFDPLESNWPQQVSFPIFFANAVSWLDAARAESEALTLTAGESMRFAISEAVAEATITLPGGNQRNVPVDPETGEMVFAETTKRGVYRLSAGGLERDFVVNPASSSESLNLPADRLNLGPYLAAEAGDVKEANVEIWRWLVAFGLLLLAFEWWYFHRRVP